MISPSLPEATISRADVGGERLYTLILRDVNERVKAEKDLHRLRQEIVNLREEIGAEFRFEDIIYSSQTMGQVLEGVKSVAPTESTALILGETGTGKELIARAIHNLSRRREQTLLTVNCAALPGGLIESELFGHEKGAFTGALSRKIGRFERAHGGTIFLDEIGDLPPELQAKLLRVLQEGEFERVGSSQTIRVDVRVIAATHNDLAREVQEGRFRADLFYRLNVFPLRIPPLRERREDIAPLVRHFAMRYAANTGRKIEHIPKQALASLRSYDWPGNVRELQNVVERSMILSQGPELNLGSWLPGDPGLTPGGNGHDEHGLGNLADIERQHITRVLESTGGRVSGAGGAAQILGLKRTTLEARMKKLGIDRKR